MLRDVPKIYLIFFAFGISLLMMLLSYTNGYIRGGDTLSLNDIALTSAVSEIDQMSRLEKSTLVLDDTFETKVWEELVKRYPSDSEVMFDYLFDTEINPFHGTHVPEKASSTTYTVGGSKTPREGVGVYNKRPVKAIRVKVRKVDDNVTAGTNNWTYVSTIKLDAAEKYD